MSTINILPPIPIPLKVYRFSNEISQMCFIFGGMKEMEEDVIQLIEDLVKIELTNLILSIKNSIQSRSVTSISSSGCFLTIESLLFHLRSNLILLNRLRIYLGWKDVRKKAKESTNDHTDELEEEDPIDKLPKSTSLKIQLPWELNSVYCSNDLSYSDEEDDQQDNIKVYEQSKLLLKETDELTKAMTKEEYLRYADCRQASFTYRKAKRFKEFVNLSAIMEGNPTEEVMDILGFLAFEFIKQLITSSKFQKSQKIKLENVIDSVVLEVGVVEKGKGKAVKSKLHFNRSISALPLPLITPISLFSPSTSSSTTLTTSTGLSKSDSINSLEILQSLESLQQIQLKKKEFGFNKFGKGKRKRENGLI